MFFERVKKYALWFVDIPLWLLWFWVLIHCANVARAPDSPVSYILLAIALARLLAHYVVPPPDLEDLETWFDIAEGIISIIDPQTP